MFQKLLDQSKNSFAMFIIIPMQFINHPARFIRRLVELLKSFGDEVNRFVIYG